MIQWALEQPLKNTVVAFSDTGWASDDWKRRVVVAEQWLGLVDFTCLRIKSEGMISLIIRKKAWPRQGMQFCTEHLKILPAQVFLDKIDPDKNAICLVGIRREESQGRRDFPEWTENSDRHGGRSLWAPLVRLTEKDRNALVMKTPFKVLAHRSHECFPCVNSNRNNLRLVTEDRIKVIERVEAQTGHTMFRPYRHMGAKGIREVIRWANSSHGKFEGTQAACDSGFCGD